MNAFESFAQPDETPELRASELHSSLGEQLGAIAGGAFMGGVRTLVRGSEFMGAEHGVDPLFAGGAAMMGPAGVDFYERAMADRAAEPDLPIADAKARVKQEGLEGQLKLPEQETMRPHVLDMMIEDAHERRQYQAAVERGPQGFVPGALGFLTELGAGIIDPVNAAAFAIPVMGEARYGMLLARAGDSILARAGVRAGVGAAQGAVGGAVLAPADWWLKTHDGLDYTMADALHSVILSAGMGAAFHGGGGAVGDIGARLRGRPLPGSPEDLRARAVGGDVAAAETVEGLPAEEVPGITPAPPAADEPIGEPPARPEAGPGNEAAPPLESAHGRAPEGLTPEIDAAAKANFEKSARAAGFSEEDARAIADQTWEQLRTDELPPEHPARVLADLPPEVQQDVVRSAIADVIGGKAVRAGELLAEAAKEDPRIAESVDGFTARDRGGYTLLEPAPLRALSAAVPAEHIGLLRTAADAIEGLRGRLRDMFARAAEAPPSEPGKLDLGEVTADGAERINELLRQAGVPADVRGYRHEVDAYAARHSFKEHGASEREAPRGQVALTPDDWAMIPEVLAAPDRVDYLGRTKSARRDAIGVLKRINGHVLLIEEVRTGRRTLAVASIRKFKAGGEPGPGRPDALVGTPSQNVRDALPGDGNVTEAATAGNGETLLEREPDSFDTSQEFWHGTTHQPFTEFKAPTGADDTLGPAIYLSRHRGGAEFYGSGRGGATMGPFWVRANINIVKPDTIVPFHFNFDGTVRMKAPAINVLGWLRHNLITGHREAYGEGLSAAEYTRQFWKRRGVDGYDSGLEVAIYDPANIKAGFTAMPGRGQRADWQALRDAAHEPDEDLAEASQQAASTPEPASVDAVKAPGAAEKAAADAETLLADILPQLSKEERTAFEERLNEIGQDKEAREQIVREAAACLLKAME